MKNLLTDNDVIDRVFHHIDNQTTDLGDETWREPIENYSSATRLAAEIRMFHYLPQIVCPVAALPKIGSYVARQVAGVPIVAVRGEDGIVRAFRNACRHRGLKLAEGTGCIKAFVCRYHGWMYHLDGRLRHVPHEHGFPGLDRDSHGMVAVAAEERHGMVFINLEDPLGTKAPWPIALICWARNRSCWMRWSSNSM